MTPQEKAHELIEKFKAHDYDWIAQGNIQTVKKNALIVVNEIQSQQISHPMNWGTSPTYWAMVKNEIEKL